MLILFYLQKNIFLEANQHMPLLFKVNSVPQ